MQELKNIISVFIKKDPSEISDITTIDKTVIQGSILIHRMYAEIAKLGYQIDDFFSIQTYSDLLIRIGEKEKADNAPITTDQIREENNGIGIDIETIKNLPKTADFREEEFYKQNFSPGEISSCILKSNPLQSFAGLFAAKEALVKADNSLLGIPFNNIEINFQDQGKPFYPGFEVSISHQNEVSIAVAVKKGSLMSQDNSIHKQLRLEIDTLKRKIKTVAILLTMVLIGFVSWILVF